MHMHQGSEDLCIRGWDTRAPARQPAIHLTGYVYFPLCLSISPNDVLLSSGCKGFNSVGCEVKVWDIRSNNVLHNLSSHSQDVKSCQYINDQLLLSVSKDGSCAIWNTQIGTKVVWCNTNKLQYTDCAIGSTGATTDNKLRFALSSFDGSVTLASCEWSKLLSTTDSQDGSTTTCDFNAINIEYVSAAVQSTENNDEDIGEGNP